MVTPINPSPNQPYIPPQQQPTEEQGQHVRPSQTPANLPTHHNTEHTGGTENNNAVQPMQLIQQHHGGGGGHGHHKVTLQGIDAKPKKISREMRYSSQTIRKQVLDDLKKLEQEKKTLLRKKENEDRNQNQGKQQQNKEKGQQQNPKKGRKIP